MKSLEPALVPKLPDDASTLTFLRTLIGNPVEATPSAAYHEPYAVRRVFGRDLVYVAQPELVHRVLTDDAIFGQNEGMLRALAPLLGHGVLTSEGPRWRHQRRSATPAFRNEPVQRLLPVMAALADAACDRWLARPDETLSLTAAMTRLTLDVILAVLLPGASAIDPDRFGARLTDYLERTSWAIALSLARAPRWTPYPGRGTSMRAARELRAMVLAALRQDHADTGLLGLLRSQIEPETGRAFTEAELLDNLLTFIAAGHETTANTLAWTLYLLALHPAVEGAVLEELSTCPDIPDPAALPYLRRVVQESMRLYPAAALLVRTVRVPTELGGRAMPAGTSIHLPLFAVHRHRSAWTDPERFDPDRFLPEPTRARHRFAYLPFGAGPRACVGATLAMTEAVALLATVLRRTRFTLAPGCRPQPYLRVTLRPKGDVLMRVAARQAETVRQVASA